MLYAIVILMVMRLWPQSMNWQWWISGLLTGVGLLVPFGYVLVLIGLCLQLALLKHNEASWRKVARGSFVAYSTHMLIVLAWGLGVVPLTQLGVSPVLQASFVTFLWVSSSLVIALGMATVFALFSYLNTHNQFGVYIGFPFMVLAGELFGRVLFSLYTLGPDGGLNAAFSFGQLGYALAAHGLLVHAAQFGGVYALTLLVGGLAALLYLGYTRLQKPIVVAV